jgi:hypothetical protein
LFKRENVKKVYKKKELKAICGKNTYIYFQLIPFIFDLLLKGSGVKARG